jgi:nitrite reductase/ring-hydroxylating ferredoxin subunit
MKSELSRIHLNEFLAVMSSLGYYYSSDLNWQEQCMFHPLAKLIDLHNGYRQLHAVDGKYYLLIQDEEQLFLIENRCPHMDAPLVNGEVSQGVIRCKAHGIAFDLTTGRAQGPLATSLECIERLTLIYDGDRVGVEI